MCWQQVISNAESFYLVDHCSADTLVYIKQQKYIYRYPQQI